MVSLPMLNPPLPLTTKSYAGIIVCRFLAGFAGGPCIVLIEGTFADIWSAETTNTYYGFLGTAQYVGAGLGKLPPSALWEVLHTDTV